jgi:regulator of RNase E activity RraA
MDNSELVSRFERLTTAHLTDGCVRAGVEVRCAPFGVQALVPGWRIAGRALPARHSGSVDVFLEAFERASAGDVLVVDNGGRTDESCVGDLISIEAMDAGLSGILIWGLNRDTVDIREIGLPVFSLGTLPTGPLSVSARAGDALASAMVGSWSITSEDVVFGDEDGALFIPAAALESVLGFAETIRDTERGQATRIADGHSLRDQVHFSEFLAARDSNPDLTFRDHLKAVGGAIEV